MLRKGRGSTERSRKPGLSPKRCFLIHELGVYFCKDAGMMMLGGELALTEAQEAVCSNSTGILPA